MIPLCRQEKAGHYLRRVILVRDGAMTPSVDAPTAPTVRIRLYACNGTKKDLLGTFDSAKHKMDAMGFYPLTGSTDLDRRLNVGDVIAVDPGRYGFGAPRLRGFACWVTTVFKGA